MKDISAEAAARRHARQQHTRWLAHVAKGDFGCYACGELLTESTYVLRQVDTQAFLASDDPFVWYLVPCWLPMHHGCTADMWRERCVSSVA